MSARVVLSFVVLALAATPAARAQPALVKQGKNLYGQYCVSCHGANGRGVAPSAQARIGAGPQRLQRVQPRLGPPIRGVGALAADFYLRTGYMPLPRTGTQPRRRRLLLSEAQIRALVAYVASLGGGPAIPTPHPERGSLPIGQRSFAEHCAGCHQIVARGGYVTDAIPPALEAATDRQIAQAVRIGPYVMPRFTKAQISDAELNSLVRYVDYANHPDDKGGWAIGHVGPVPEGLVAWFFGATALVGMCLLLGTRLRRG
jgi:ubiquinol-cytochrome c reductase cytochrome c subunit